MLGIMKPQRINFTGLITIQKHHTISTSTMSVNPIRQSALLMATISAAHVSTVIHQSGLMHTDECKTGQHKCHLKIADSVCVNTDGSYQCICDQYHLLSGVTCIKTSAWKTTETAEKMQTASIKLEHLRFASAKTATLVILTQLTRSILDVPCNSEEASKVSRSVSGVVLRYGWTDLDECSQSDAETICPENASCVNTVGSYKCNCDPGYTMTAQSKCEPVDLCEVHKTDCDPYFADCIQSGGTATCYCKAYFTGSGKSGDCVPMTGHENLACTLEGTSCTSYEECTRNITAGTYSCRALRKTRESSAAGAVPTDIEALVGIVRANAAAESRFKATPLTPRCDQDANDVGIDVFQ
ncbi:calcium binding egf domain-containing protein [Toxoplasma gondii RUB]|uniref:Calcium binding egf domain-containing protein n=4 Tax=Toxoplasma gondii TaxID=5811 RepID=S7UME6_TOXGG|nr:calcium binding egf domain-containing protein [Toxoplasma gondii GT1]KFG66351.1 calcium binding egf domain-containing protein [Toxoplasma gondii RUB]KFH02079.1 calcium binding egf domain-containing protein [Toxoplasma gondii VAND]RQX70899.1 calcium binding egf domain-containing protein [Toxoplasma gondii CAST]